MQLFHTLQVSFTFRKRIQDRICRAAVRLCDSARELMLETDLNFRTLPTALPELEAKSEGGVMKRKDRRRRGKWRTGGGPTGSYTLPTMSPLWRTLLLELYGSDQNAVEKLLTSLFKSGFRSGYANVSVYCNFFCISSVVSFAQH